MQFLKLYSIQNFCLKKVNSILCSWELSMLLSKSPFHSFLLMYSFFMIWVYGNYPLYKWILELHQIFCYYTQCDNENLVHIFWARVFPPSEARKIPWSYNMLNFSAYCLFSLKVIFIAALAFIVSNLYSC